MNEHSLIGVLTESNLNIHRALFVRLDNSWNFETRGSVFSRLYFVRAGSGFIKTESQELTFKPGHVYFIPPGAKFSCGCEYMEKTFFHISFPTVERYDFFSGRDRIYELPYSVERQDALTELLKTDDYLDIMKIKLLILEVVLDFCKTHPEESKKIKKYTPLTERMIAYIDEHLSAALTVADISAALFLSSSKIRNTFKDEIGVPIGKYIDDMIFIKARRELIETGKPVAAVAAELGFCDQFYFSKRFSEKIGKSPSSFKSENKIT